MSISIDAHYMKTNPSNYLASQPRMSTRLAEHIIRDHREENPAISYDDFAANYPDACVAGDAMIWIHTRDLMEYLGYKV